MISSKDLSDFDSLYFFMTFFVFNCPAAVAECVLITIVKRATLFQIFLLVLLFVLNNTKLFCLNKLLGSFCACLISSGTHPG